MRKVVLAAVGKLEYQEAPLPETRYGWVRVRLLRCGICGTDVHNYYKETIFGKDAYPFHMGHETCGVVDAVGDGVQGLRVGDQVVINPFWTCGACEPCRMGSNNNCEHRTTIGLTGPSGNSEYTLAPAASVIKTDPNVDPTLLAFTEPVATVLYALDKLKLDATKDVLITGAGPIGLIFLQLLKHAQINSLTVSDILEGKLHLAKKLGADRVINTAKEEDRRKYDVIIDCTGIPQVVEQQFRKVKFGAQVMIFGVCPIDSTVTLHPFALYSHDVTICTSYALNSSAFTRALHLIQSGRIDIAPLLAGVYPVGMLEECIHNIKAGKINGKIVIDTTRME